MNYLSISVKRAWGTYLRHSTLEFALRETGLRASTRLSDPPGCRCQADDNYCHFSMTGLVTAEAQERTPGGLPDQTPSPPVRQPSKEDLELAHQLLQHSEGRRDAGDVLSRTENARSSDVFGAGTQFTTRNVEPVERVDEGGVKRGYTRKLSPSAEMRRDRGVPGPMNGAPQMGQVCRYVVWLLVPNQATCCFPEPILTIV